MEVMSKKIEEVGGKKYIVTRYRGKISEAMHMASLIVLPKGTFFTALVPWGVMAYMVNSGKQSIKTVDETPLCLVPAVGQIVFAVPVQGIVNIEVKGRRWEITFGKNKKVGVAEGANFEGVLTATKEALSELKETKRPLVKRLVIRNQHVVRMIRGDMQSRKHPELLREVRELIKKKRVVLA